MKLKKSLVVLAVLGVMAAAGFRIYAHCEIPCGIYDDPMRMKMIHEHIRTIGKSIHEIGHLEAAEKPDANQLTRWIINKDDHADQLRDIVTQYFMTQRLKPLAPGDPGYEKYIRELTLLHALLVEAMKSKQVWTPRRRRRCRCWRRSSKRATSVKAAGRRQPSGGVSVNCGVHFAEIFFIPGWNLPNPGLYFLKPRRKS